MAQPWNSTLSFVLSSKDWEGCTFKVTPWQNIEKKKDILPSLFFSFFLCPVIVCFELCWKQVFGALEVPSEAGCWKRQHGYFHTRGASGLLPEDFLSSPACAPLPGCVRWCQTLTPHCVIEYSGNLGKIQRPSIVEAAAWMKCRSTHGQNWGMFHFGKQTNGKKTMVGSHKMWEIDVTKWPNHVFCVKHYYFSVSRSATILAMVIR